jgi:hypothetical protein
MGIEIESHDTRVISLHPLKNGPQLVGISRHISGSYSVNDLNWKESNKTLSGTSETIPGDSYSLFIYVPEMMRISKVSAGTLKNGELKVEQERIGNALKISFLGQSEMVNWSVGF